MIFNKNIDPKAKLGVTKTALANGKFIVGDANGGAAEVSSSGDVTFSNSGAFTIGASKVLTGMLATDAVEAADIKADAVETAKIKDANVTTAKLESSLVQFKKTTLTNAELKAVRATPIELVAAPGANKLIVVHQIYLHLDYGSDVLTESTDNLVVQYDGGLDITGAIESGGFIDASADTWTSVLPVAMAGNAAGSVGFNKKVEIFNTGDGEFGGNATADTTLDVYVTYSTADFS